MTILLAFLVVLFALERLHCTFGSVPHKKHKGAFKERLFTSAMLFFYAGIVIVDAAYYFKILPASNSLFVGLGALLLVIGIASRRWAIKSLGHDWSVYINCESINRVGFSGPFQYSRHPYYWASLLELFGISLLLHCLAGVFLSFFIYFPLLILRGILEEKEMLKKFPLEYSTYKKTVPFFLSLKSPNKTR